jgi:hypothetical protein
MTMNRREFGKSLAAVGAMLALPFAAKAGVDRTMLGQHLWELDNNDAILSTLQKAFATLWYGNCRPEMIVSSPRVVGRLWNALVPRQRVMVYVSSGIANKSFVFNGATVSADSRFLEEIALKNFRYDEAFAPDTWRRFNGWYLASRTILDDPFGDECFERMIRS